MHQDSELSTQEDQKTSYMKKIKDELSISEKE